jgi:hypothetical protein
VNASEGEKLRLDEITYMGSVKCAGWIDGINAQRAAACIHISHEEEQSIYQLPITNYQMASSK